MSFSENLKAMLDANDMQIKELSAKTGISKNTIDNYLSGQKSLPNAENAVCLAEALGTTVEYLVTGRDKSVPPHIRKNVADLLKDLNRLRDEDLRHLKYFLGRIK